MCGILGFVDDKLGHVAGKALLEKMLDITMHRGPDNTSLWLNNNIFLGHNRLSIIDLSKDANQPMHYKNLTIVFNGEVYNYLEIRNELESLGFHFSTASDTEVILVSYKAWGHSCVEKFVGMWAFAIWDETDQTLFCSRDRFGIKPFYYFTQNGSFYFASEIKALKQSGDFRSDLNIDQISIYLQIGWYFNKGQTFYKNVNTLPAGHNLICKAGKIQLVKYWNIIEFDCCTLTNQERLDRFKSLFYDSIKLHIRSDVEVGACLSGGLDSSAIASVYSSIFTNNRLKAFNIYYDGTGEADERPWVEILKNKYTRLDTHYYSPTNDDIADHFDNFIHHMEFPSNGSSPFSQYFVMKLANSHGIKVVLNGQGSDEYLAGYMHGMYRYMADDLLNLKFGKFYNHLIGHKKLQGYSIKKTMDVILKSVLSGIFSEQGLYKLEYQRYFPFISQLKKEPPFQIEKQNTNRLNQFLYHQVMQSSLPNLLHNEDSNSMAFSIESRVPFLDHRLVEFCFTLQSDDKVKHGMTKQILRKALSKELPIKIANRTDKIGFVTPGETKWLKGPLKFLLEADDFNIDFLQSDKVNHVINEYKHGNLKYANFVWRIVVLNYWLQNHH